MQKYQTPEEKREYKARKKAMKKRMIAQYGYVYYLRDKTWFNVKDQRPDENFDAWKNRLAFYGFTTDGTDAKNGKRHFAEPNVHDWGEAEAVEAEAVEAEAVEEIAEEAAEEAVEEAAEEAVDVAILEEDAPAKE